MTTIKKNLVRDRSPKASRNALTCAQQCSCERARLYVLHAVPATIRSHGTQKERLEL